MIALLKIKYVHIVWNVQHIRLLSGRPHKVSACAQARSGGERQLET